MRDSLYFFAKYDKLLTIPFLQRATGRYVVCPYYHVVSQTDQPFISPLYKTKTIEQFLRDLDWLQQNFQPIKWSEIDDFEKRKVPAFCLTFDDGLREMYDVVAPILKERDIPALCFVNSDFTDNKSLFYRYKVAYIISELQKKGKLTKTVRELLLATKYNETNDLDKIADEMGIVWSEILKEHKPYLTLEQIKTMCEQGWEFGSHSKDHPMYSSLTTAEQEVQTAEGDKFIEDNRISCHKLFAFPFGQENLSEERIMQEINTHDAVFGTANLRKTHNKLYNRIWMENTQYLANEIVKGEYLREWIHQIKND